MLSNESSESFYIWYSDTKLLLFCDIFYYLMVQIRVGYIINCSSTIKSK